MVVGTAREVAAASDVVVTCLPDGPEWEACVSGVDGLLAGGRPGLIVIDTSTINPRTRSAVAEQAAQRGATVLDAPMSGGEAGAISRDAHVHGGRR